jgi:Tripartite tricarboxylate transporter family receptor
VPPAGEHKNRDQFTGHFLACRRRLSLWEDRNEASPQRIPAFSRSSRRAPGGVTQRKYPSRPIRLIIGFTPGAASDIIGRVFAKGAGPVIGQEVVVENKPGAGSSIAAEYVARADKDGYTLFVPALSTLTDEIVAGRSVDMSEILRQLHFNQKAVIQGRWR